MCWYNHSFAHLQAYLLKEMFLRWAMWLMWLPKQIKSIIVFIEKESNIFKKIILRLHSVISFYNFFFYRSLPFDSHDVWWVRLPSHGDPARPGDRQGAPEGSPEAHEMCRYSLCTVQTGPHISFQINFQPNYFFSDSET